MPYVAPSDVGEGEVWHLGTVIDDYPDFMQEINSNGDTIAIYEAERILHYVVRGDTLLDKREQSRRAHNIYNVERPMLRYPFLYRDSIAGGYGGTGRYEQHTFATGRSVGTGKDQWGLVHRPTEVSFLFLAKCGANIFKPPPTLRE